MSVLFLIGIMHGARDLRNYTNLLLDKIINCYIFMINMLDEQSSQISQVVATGSARSVVEEAQQAKEK